MTKKIKVISILILAILLYCGALGVVFNSFSNIDATSERAFENVDLPIIMYHSVLKDTALSGKYTVTPDTLRRDIDYLKQCGYTFVSAQDIINHSVGIAPLPKKCVMLTFDDGFYNNYGYVIPILHEKNVCGVISIVGSYTDEYSENNIANMTYGYMRWSEVYDMFTDKNVDVGNHSYAFHSNTNGRNGSQRKHGEDTNEYIELFTADTLHTQNRCMEKTGFFPIIYTYPFGAYSEETTDVLKSLGFKISFTCNEGINKISTPESLFMLKRYNRPSGISSEDFFKILN